MRDVDPDSSRRRFLRGAVAGAIAAPVVGLLATTRTLAADKPKLDPSSSQATALQYVHAASDASDKAAYQEGAICGNCLQWTGGDSQWGGCNIFPQKRVNRDGWCSAWAEA
jgi:hypothetical protein